MDGWLPEPVFEIERNEWEEQEAFATLVSNALENGGAPKLDETSEA